MQKDGWQKRELWRGSCHKSIERTGYVCYTYNSFLRDSRHKRPIGSGYNGRQNNETAVRRPPFSHRESRAKNGISPTCTQLVGPSSLPYQTTLCNGVFLFPFQFRHRHEPIIVLCFLNITNPLVYFPPYLFIFSSSSYQFSCHCLLTFVLYFFFSFTLLLRLVRRSVKTRLGLSGCRRELWLVETTRRMIDRPDRTSSISLIILFHFFFVRRTRKLNDLSEICCLAIPFGSNKSPSQQRNFHVWRVFCLYIFPLCAHYSSSCGARCRVR